MKRPVFNWLEMSRAGFQEKRSISKAGWPTSADFLYMALDGRVLSIPEVISKFESIHPSTCFTIPPIDERSTAEFMASALEPLD